MARKPLPENTSMSHVSVRLDPAILARIDALVPAFSTKWRTAFRSDVVRALILDGLRLAEARAKPSKSAKKGGGDGE